MHYETMRNKNWVYAEDESSRRLTTKVVRAVRHHWHYWLTIMVLAALVVGAWLQVSVARQMTVKCETEMTSTRGKLQKARQAPGAVFDELKRKFNELPSFHAGVKRVEPTDPLAVGVTSYCHAKLAALEERVQLVWDATTESQDEVETASDLRKRLEKELNEAVAEKDKLSEEVKLVQAQEATIKEELRTTRVEKENLQAQAEILGQVETAKLKERNVPLE
ncbi:hypothetical protein FOA52_002990 [Chlamydomonas sp. UWO 241]|nr:hypothetical protein FOA52_002990 [Chlamydomonas sp. UWO 241]